VVPDTMNALTWLRKHLDGEGGNDVICEIVKVFAEELMSAEADSACGAAWGEQPRAGEFPKRLPQPGLRHPGRTDRAGPPEAAPRPLLPHWLLEPRRRANKALVAVVGEALGWRSSTPPVWSRHRQGPA
jgi:putative transposase